ncbi:SAM domain-containing protein SAMSN-1b [Thunnus albacares]|uniref:SAM domain-containing protein SAMSN-1b n=1 Tax=Thunnus albacares TaxID=8236 RepID=UPI001CF61A52|nr:SAM domain-containing protein SAMSN-1b [Thunnus albacares]XP_044225951.1 SAM domain-containing protein SAMSN-1b [Thunnus albacares]
MSSCDKKDLSHQNKVQSRETCKAPCQSGMLTRDDRVKELNSQRTQTHLPAQGGETAADTAESMHTTRRLKKLQNLVQAKRGHQSGAGKGKNTSENDDDLADVLSDSNPVLTCIGLGKRTEKKPCKTAPSPQQRRQQQQAKDVCEDSEEEGFWSPRVRDHLWSPFDCSQPWSPFYHTCQQPRHELWGCGGTLSLPRTTEWDRFESLIQELDSKQSDLSPPQMIRSITDLHLTQNTLTRFGRFDAFRQHSPLMKTQDNGSSLDQNGEPTKLKLQGRKMETSSQSDRSHIKALPEKTLTAIINGETQEDKVEKREVGGGWPFTKGHRRSSNSLESLYSLNSRQSSSSGVTSGSNCSSNRGSLRLEDDLSYTRQFCGRARVHTDFVPSPYDTESLKLKAGDVIDIISKPPMGIWTGILNNRIGNFKFIYVDVLTEEIHEEIQTHRLRHKYRSTIHEVLKRLSLEEYSSSLQLNGYQTVDDLMRLREHHLTELNVTDPEHRHRLLAAVDSLQQLRSDCQLQNEANQGAETPSENMKADMNNCPRDSGCHMPSDSPDNSGEDTDLHFPSEHPLPAETTAS